MDSLKGIIEKVIYTGDNNYAIISVKLPGIGKPVTACGNIESPIKKTEISMEGTWHFNEQYKEKQFIVERAECKIDKKNRAAIQFLSSGLIKYVGEVTARSIVEEFGTNFDKIISNPYLLIKIKGLTEARLPEIAKSIKEHKGIFDIYNAVNGEITKNQAELIYKKYGDDSARKISENPYVLIYDIKGFGFKKADALARNIGFELESSERCKAGLLHCFREAADEKGHCFLYYQDALQRAGNLLITSDDVKEIYYKRILKTSVPDLMSGFLELPLGDLIVKHKIKFNNLIDNLEEAIFDEEDVTQYYDRFNFSADEIECIEMFLHLKAKICEEINHILTLESYKIDQLSISESLEKAKQNLEMENPYRFFADKDKKGNWRYFEAKTYLLELQVSHALVAMAKKESTLSYTDKECDDLIKDYENDNEIELGEEQKEAVKKTLKNRVSIITGGPGRGKTTIEDIIIKGWKAKGGKTILLAPTGRAAQRMTQATEEEAKTIQRKLLAYETGCDEESYFLPTLVLVDEMSMCTLQLLARLINFSKAGDIHFTFIGDANQLPCIGLGDVFKDMIKSGLIPCTKLLKCYRNAGAISYNSDIINNGGMMRDFKKDNTFKFVTMESVESVQETIINLYGKMKERFKPDEIGIIVPCRKSGKTCANELNRLIQEKYNLFTGKKNEIHYKDKLFRVNDRIIHTRNCYNMQYEDRYGIGLGVFNGETGTITKIDPYAKIIYVQFDGDDEKQVIYDFEHMKFLELAYAITVHKAQGSEYKCVISAFVNGDYNLLCRNMIYTAETRAKELMILLGSNKAIAMAISNAYVEMRNTTVYERIREFWDTDSEENDVIDRNELYENTEDFDVLDIVTDKKGAA